MKTEDGFLRQCGDVSRDLDAAFASVVLARSPGRGQVSSRQWTNDDSSTHVFVDGDPEVGESLDQELLSELVCAHRGECVTCMAHRFEFLATLYFSALFTRPWLVSLFALRTTTSSTVSERVSPSFCSPSPTRRGVMQNTILYRGRGVTTDLIRSTTRMP